MTFMFALLARHQPASIIVWHADGSELTWHTNGDAIREHQTAAAYLVVLESIRISA